MGGRILFDGLRFYIFRAGFFSTVCFVIVSVYFWWSYVGIFMSVRLGFDGGDIFRGFGVSVEGLFMWWGFCLFGERLIDSYDVVFI